MFTKMFFNKLFKLQLLSEVKKLQEIEIKMSAEQPNTTGEQKIPPSPHCLLEIKLLSCV